MTDSSHLDVEPDVVTTAGQQVADTADGWQSWAGRISTAFGDASHAPRNAALGHALRTYAARWNPQAQMLAGQVDALGGHLHTAGTVVDGTDADAAQAVVGQTQRSGGQASLLSRSIHV